MTGPPPPSQGGPSNLGRSRSVRRMRGVGLVLGLPVAFVAVWAVWGWLAGVVATVAAWAVCQAWATWREWREFQYEQEVWRKNDQDR